MLMLYAIAAPVWLLACMIGALLLLSTRTRRLAAYVILVPSFAYWLPLLTTIAFLLLMSGRASEADAPGWLFAIVFLGSQALAGLVGLVLGTTLAAWLTNARRLRSEKGSA